MGPGHLGSRWSVLPETRWTLNGLARGSAVLTSAAFGREHNRARWRCLAGRNTPKYQNNWMFRPRKKIKKLPETQSQKKTKHSMWSAELFDVRYFIGQHMKVVILLPRVCTSLPRWVFLKHLAALFSEHCFGASTRLGKPYPASTHVSRSVRKTRKYPKHRDSD